MLIKSFNLILLLCLPIAFAVEHHHSKKHVTHKKHHKANSNLDKSHSNLATASSPSNRTMKHSHSGKTHSNPIGGKPHSNPTVKHSKGHAKKSSHVKKRSVNDWDSFSVPYQTHARSNPVTNSSPFTFEPFIKTSDNRGNQEYVSARKVEVKELDRIREDLRERFDTFTKNSFASSLWTDLFKEVEHSLHRMKKVQEQRKSQFYRVYETPEKLGSLRGNGLNPSSVNNKQANSYTSKPLFHWKGTTSKPITINWGNQLKRNSFPTFPPEMITESYSQIITNKDIHINKPQDVVNGHVNKDIYRNLRKIHEIRKYTNENDRIREVGKTRRYHHHHSHHKHGGSSFPHHESSSSSAMASVFSRRNGYQNAKHFNLTKSFSLSDQHSSTLLEKPSDTTQEFQTSGLNEKNNSKDERSNNESDTSFPGKFEDRDSKTIRKKMLDGDFKTDEDVPSLAKPKLENGHKDDTLCKDGGSIEIPLLNVNLPCGDLSKSGGHPDDYYKREFAASMSNVFHDYIEKEKAVEEEKYNIDVRSKSKRSVKMAGEGGKRNKIETKNSENKTYGKSSKVQKERNVSVFGEIMEVPKDLTKGESAEYFDISMLSEYFLEAVENLDEASLVDVIKALKEDYLSKSPNDQMVVDEVYEKLVSSLLDYKRSNGSWAERRRRESPSKSKKGAAAVLELLAESDKYMEEMQDDPFANDYYGDYTDKDQSLDSNDNPSFLELVSLADKHKSKAK